MKKCAVAQPIYVSNSHTNFGWISSNGLGGDSVTDRRRRLQYPHRFFVLKSVGTIRLFYFDKKRQAEGPHATVSQCLTFFTSIKHVFMVIFANLTAKKEHITFQVCLVLNK